VALSDRLGLVDSDSGALLYASKNAMEAKTVQLITEKVSHRGAVRVVSLSRELVAFWSHPPPRGPHLMDSRAPEYLCRMAQLTVVSLATGRLILQQSVPLPDTGARLGEWGGKTVSCAPFFSTDSKSLSFA
jgi:hypothetical protein